MSDTKLGKCWNCGIELGPHDYGRETNCLKCGKPSRVCRNCRWYAPGQTNECKEPVAERVMEKEKPNYCDFFEPASDPVGGGSGPEDELLNAAEDLFKF
ncbi:MAG: hypothetical protein ABW140_09635 [Candidatus Sedimenticola sp. 6PFRAG1]